MRRVRDVIRLKEAGVGIREIARQVDAAPSTVRETLKRVATVEVTWPLPTGITDAALEPRPFANALSRSVCRAHGWYRRRRVGTRFPISFCFRGARRVARGGLARLPDLCRR